MDGGNEWFPNSIRRYELLAQKGINFVGMGISGGEEVEYKSQNTVSCLLMLGAVLQGARNGPSLMPGCTKEVYDVLAPIITKCAAQVDDGPCTTYLGPIGSGNYVKMVHNGIEYGTCNLFNGNIILRFYSCISQVTCNLLQKFMTF